MDLHQEHYHPSGELSYIHDVETPAVVRQSLTDSRNSTVTSTQSWLYHSNTPVPALPSSDLHAGSSVRKRPLPDPQLYAHQPPLRAVNADPIYDDDEDDEEYMNIDPGGPGVEFGYQTEGLGRGKKFPSFNSSPPPQFNPEPKGRSFVGGFVRGLKRLPRSMFRMGEKKSDGTITTGNTLPLYASNPPTPTVGQSNARYPQPPIVASPLQDSTLPASISHRSRHPSFRVTPPSDDVLISPEDDPHLYSNFAPQDGPKFPEIPPDNPPSNPERTTVMVYQEGMENPEPDAEPTSHHISMLPQVTRPGDSRSVNDPIPRRSHPDSDHPLPTNDYRKMTLSPGRTERTTMTTITSTEPSFSYALSPVQRFFYVLYHMPWISHERVTVDYRPGVGAGGQSGGRRVSKKPSGSWYKTAGTASRRNVDIDLLSNGGGTHPRNSADTNMTSIPSPASRARVRRSSTQPYPPSQVRHHRKPRRRGTVTGAHGVSDIQHQRHTSPLIPAIYPYNFPQYPYPYPAYPPPAQTSPQGPRSHRRSQSYANGGYAPYQSMPLPVPGPPPPAPVYIFHTSPTQTQSSGDGGQAQQFGQGQVLSPVYMQLVPGHFSPEIPGMSPLSSPTAKGPTTQAA